MVSALSLMEIIMFKKIVEIYRVIMDLRYNPLRLIPDPILQGYLLMALFVMWCLFFGLIAIYHMGQLWDHKLILRYPNPLRRTSNA